MAQERIEAEWKQREINRGRLRLIFIRDMQFIKAIRDSAIKDGCLDEFIESWIENPDLKVIWEDLEMHLSIDYTIKDVTK